jgi:SAM-dependent methyltransferase
MMDVCILCQHNEFEPLEPYWFNTTWKILGQKVSIDPYMCPECGLVFLHPAPDPDLLDRYYAEQDRFYSETAAYEEQAKFINLEKDNAHILDVGAFDGRLLEALVSKERVMDRREAGYMLYGIEPDGSVKPQVPYLLIGGDMDTAIDTNEKMDLITMAHVLEHLAHPLATLKTARDRLSDDGRLFVEVPNLETPYIHLWYFTPNTLRGLLSRAGFGVEREQLTGYGAVRMLARRRSPIDRPDIYPIDNRTWADRYFRKRAGEALRLQKRMETLNGKQIAIFGTGFHSRFLLNLITQSPTLGFEIVRFVVTDWSGPDLFEGFEVRAAGPEAWADVDAVILSSYDSQEEMAEAVGEKAFKLYDEVNAYDTWQGET